MDSFLAQLTSVFGGELYQNRREFATIICHRIYDLMY
jgi:hypothetical protein